MTPRVDHLNARPIDELRLYRFSLPFRRSIAGQKERLGHLLWCRRGDFVGWGEVSPWPGLHAQSHEMLERTLPSILSECLRHWIPEHLCQAVLVPPSLSPQNGSSAVDLSLAWLQALSPLVSWGVISASLELIAAEKNIRLAQLFRTQAPSSVQSAALILEDQDLETRDYGNYVAIKVKSRRADDLDLLTRVRQALPDIEIRADGNRMLSMEEAWQMHKSSLPYGVRFFEEPAPPEVLPQLIAKGVAIALDEYLVSESLDSSLLADALLWVIKPSVLGPSRTFSLLQTKKPVVLSSPFESAIGRNVLAHLQAAFAPDEAAGLGVSQYFAADLIEHDGPVEVIHCAAPTAIDFGHLQEMGRWVRA